MKNKEFKLKNLFNIFGSKYFSPKKLEDGTTPFLDKTQLNNGIVRTVNARNEKLNLGNAITIGDHSAIAFYQEEPFLTSDHMNKLYLKPEFGILNRNIALYLCTEINNQIKGRYNYSFILAKNRCENIIISLPVDSNGKPD
jgi:hypothetical protein